MWTRQYYIVCNDSHRMQCLGLNLIGNPHNFFSKPIFHIYWPDNRNISSKYVMLQSSKLNLRYPYTYKLLLKITILINFGELGSSIKKSTISVINYHLNWLQTHVRKSRCNFIHMKIPFFSISLRRSKHD